MLEDQVGALRAWNAIDQPTLNSVRVEGLHRTRYQTVTDTLSLPPNAILNADAFVRARHRLDELPDRAGARLALRPEDDGFASVDVSDFRIVRPAARACRINQDRTRVVQAPRPTRPGRDVVPAAAGTAASADRRRADVRVVLVDVEGGVEEAGRSEIAVGEGIQPARGRRAAGGPAGGTRRRLPHGNR